MHQMGTLINDLPVVGDVRPVGRVVRGWYVVDRRITTRHALVTQAVLDIRAIQQCPFFCSERSETALLLRPVSGGVEFEC